MRYWVVVSEGKYKILVTEGFFIVYMSTTDKGALVSRHMQNVNERAQRGTTHESLLRHGIFSMEFMGIFCFICNIFIVFHMGYHVFSLLGSV